MYTRPVYCPPRYLVRDCFVPCVHPIIHPVVHVNRLNVVNVPRHIYKPIRKNVIVEHRRPFYC
ncbi:hypothetical protein M670_02207 [Schinkia azotoformans MEV2011]|uniref:Spore coat protein D n=1 Tax=Schinkia azotoformans MEV2011 TaxID=1348973 RepID=A0A072NMC2_SCHAZ|nr:hypothetical protein M670_02207 [Schinkia azotoformans MEV2011]